MPKSNLTNSSVDIHPKPILAKNVGKEHEKACIEILMATYNGERFVREQIESIQNQTFTDWQLLISDDGSSDATLAVVQALAEKDNRISIISSRIRYGSAKANFMALMSKASAQYVMFCDQDDVWLPTKIEKTLAQMRELEKNTGIDVPLLVFTDMKVVREDLSVISNSFEEYSKIDPRRTNFAQLIAQSVGAGCTMMVNHAAVTYALRAKNINDIIMHDWWLSLIASAFGKITYLNEPTSLYRQHDNNEVGAKHYSPLANLKSINSMEKSIAKTMIQANCFAESYALKTQQKAVISNYIEAYKKRSIVLLITSGCWKRGLRKAGQIYMLLRGVDEKTNYDPIR